MKKFTHLIVVAFFLIATFMHSQDIINPIGVTMSVPNTLNTPPINIVNGEGLSEFPSITATHEDNSPTNAILYFNGSNTIDFDLGGNFDVEGFAFWNAIGPGSNNFGVKDVIISASQDGVNFTLIPGSPIEFAESMSAPALPEIFSFDAVNATHIRIVALNNHGEPSFTGISEVAFIGTSTSTDNIINPVSATTTLSALFGSNLDNTINGSGLDTFPSLSASHGGTNPGTAFYANNDSGTIDFDLGGSYLVDGLAFWNANATGPPQTGIQNVIIYSSEDGVTYTAITGAPNVFAEATGPTSVAEQFSFAEVTASFIRFEVTSNYGSPDFIGYAEVAFSGILIAAPENVINPVSATTTLSALFGSSLDNTINGSGLDTFPSLSASHGGTNPGTAFYANNDTGTIDFDLGGSYLVDGLAFWNANATGPPQTGIQNVIIYSSEDGVTYTAITGAPNVFAEATGPTSAAEQFSFDEVTASFIRFEVTSNYGSPDFIGYAEVAFSGIAIAAPENVINPVSATTTLSALFGSNLDNTINGSGLDAFPSLSASHGGANPGTAFYASNGVGTIDFDLGGSYLVDGLAFWNANATGPQQTGIQNVIIYSSEDGVTYSAITGAPNVFAEATGPTSAAEQFSFAEVTASFIRFEVTTNYGSPDFIGFSEVAFSGILIVPENNIINPVSATTTLTAQFGSSLVNTINGSGLDVFPSLSATHAGTDPGSAFWATMETGTIDFDLGGAYLVDGLAFWNANTNGPPQTGIQDVIIYSSEDGVTYTAIPGAPNVFAEALNFTSSAEQFSFAEVTASFIRFEVTTNYGNPSLIAFAEVAFSGIPTTLGITDSVLAEAISLFPNPASDVIKINNNSNFDLEGITIYDMNGRVVIQHKVIDNSGNQVINVSELASGIYMVQIYSNQASTIKRVIKK